MGYGLLSRRVFPVLSWQYAPFYPIMSIFIPSYG